MGDVVGKLMARRGSRGGGLVGLDQVDSSCACDFLHVFRRAPTVEFVIAVVLHILLVIVLVRGYNHLNLAAEHQVEAVATGGFLETGETRPVAPLVQLPAKGIGFELEHAKFTSGNQSMTTGGVDMGNRRVDD